MTVSVLILTLDEEINLPGCLQSLTWCDDVVVFDSLSTDRTAAIAEAGGARVYRRQFDNYAQQRSAALAQIEFRYPWVLMVDADERVPPALAAEITAAVGAAEPDVTLFRMRRKDFLFGRWLRRSSGYPTWFGRLVRVGQVRIERAVNEEYLTAGRIVELREHLHHQPFNKGMHWWFERHNRYSSMEAAALRSERRQAWRARELFARDAVLRRRALKRLAYRLPARPALALIYLYFLRLGLLDGLAGAYYCLLRASYEFMIEAKLQELRYQDRQRPT